jgi:hypothetical protein
MQRGDVQNFVMRWREPELQDLREDLRCCKFGSQRGVMFFVL